jgi:ssDNA-binding Zn-finger/Zn-ribbon topoisomerase 1
MKCRACGYDGTSTVFLKVFVSIPHSDLDTEIHVQDEEESAEEIIYACPQCGTLRIAVETENRFAGCKCPWCGNTYPDEFAIHKEERLVGLPGQYTNYRMTCSCGASGPDADSEAEAVEKYRKLKNAAQ